MHCMHEPASSHAKAYCQSSLTSRKTVSKWYYHNQQSNGCHLPQSYKAEGNSSACYAARNNHTFDPPPFPCTRLSSKVTSSQDTAISVCLSVHLCTCCVQLSIDSSRQKAADSIILVCQAVKDVRAWVWVQHAALCQAAPGAPSLSPCRFPQPVNTTS